MTTDEMLFEIVSYNYESYGFPYVFLDYCNIFNAWQVTWRNPVEFINKRETQATTPNSACKKALDFIKKNPLIFTK